MKQLPNNQKITLLYRIVIPYTSFKKKKKELEAPNGKNPFSHKLEYATLGNW